MVGESKGRGREMTGQRQEVEGRRGGKRRGEEREMGRDMWERLTPNGKKNNQGVGKTFNEKERKKEKGGGVNVKNTGDQLSIFYSLKDFHELWLNILMPGFISLYFYSEIFH